MRNEIVVSLFDGMSCGQIALKELGVNVVRYYASEIDKHAIQVTQHNFPDTIQLGDVTKWREWDIDWSQVTLLLGGSPCQGFSFAGKQLAFDDPRSKLFFAFYEIWQNIASHNPNAKFLLENVKMKKEHENVISQYMGRKPIEINSALVSAQNRKRLYWTNIYNKPVGLFEDMECMIPQPKDRKILLRDVLDNQVDEKYYLSEKMIDYLKVRAERYAPPNIRNGKDKSSCIMPNSEGKQGFDMNLIVVASRGRNPLVMHIPEATKKGYTEIQPGECFDLENPNSKTRRGRKMDDKANCLMAKKTDFMRFTKDARIRRLTPNECKKLQTIPDWYDMTLVSDTQQYRMLGNGWTAEVIKHILSFNI